MITFYSELSLTLKNYYSKLCKLEKCNSSKNIVSCCEAYDTFYKVGCETYYRQKVNAIEYLYFKTY